MSVLVCLCRVIYHHFVIPKTDISYWTVDMSIIYLVSRRYHFNQTAFLVSFLFTTESFLLLKIRVR